MAELTHSPLRSGKVVGFAATTDATGAREFYGQRLGLKLVSEDGWALVFDSQGLMVRIQKLKKHTPESFTVLGWNVPDIVSVVDELGRAGVPCERYGLPYQDERGIASFDDGTRVAWFKDPDGNILSVAQMPR